MNGIDARGEKNEAKQIAKLDNFLNKLNPNIANEYLDVLLSYLGQNIIGDASLENKEKIVNFIIEAKIINSNIKYLLDDKIINNDKIINFLNNLNENSSYAYFCVIAEKGEIEILADDRIIKNTNLINFLNNLNKEIAVVFIYKIAETKKIDLLTDKKFINKINNPEKIKQLNELSVGDASKVMNNIIHKLLQDRVKQKNDLPGYI
ncbi:MAG: hypothetical protein ACP5LH_03710 [Candidatus Micrarchaeia archaeon]